MAIEAADRPAVWLVLRDEAAALANAEAIDARAEAGEDLSLDRPEIE